MPSRVLGTVRACGLNVEPQGLDTIISKLLSLKGTILEAIFPESNGSEVRTTKLEVLGSSTGCGTPKDGTRELNSSETRLNEVRGVEIGTVLCERRTVQCEQQGHYHEYQCLSHIYLS